MATSLDPFRQKWKEELLEFVTGRGGARFHSPDTALTMGRGGYFGGDPRPAPVWGKSPLIPCRGPVSPNLF